MLSSSSGQANTCDLRIAVQSVGGPRAGSLLEPYCCTSTVERRKINGPLNAICRSFDLCLCFGALMRAVELIDDQEI